MCARVCMNSKQVTYNDNTNNYEEKNKQTNKQNKQNNPIQCHDKRYTNNLPSSISNFT